MEEQGVTEEQGKEEEMEAKALAKEDYGYGCATKKLSLTPASAFRGIGAY